MAIKKFEEYNNNLSEGKTLEDIAKHHDTKGYYHVDDFVSSLKNQLDKGIIVEMENTKSEKLAKEKAMNNLWEDPNYYDKLPNVKESALPQQKSVDQLKKVSKATSKTDIGKKSKKTQGQKNIKMNNVESYQDFEKSNKNSKSKGGASLTTEKKKQKEVPIKIKIKYARIPSEYKEIALNHLGSLTNCSKGKVTNLILHKDLRKKIQDKNLPSGFSMGIDKDGFFVHTHRARSKSYEKPEKITVKEIKFIDSTG